MNERKWDRWNGAVGYLVFALGVAGAAFERGAPPAGAPAAEALAFFARYRFELLMQSWLFVLSSGLYLWWLGSLRSYLLRAEGGMGRLSTVAFGAGISWAGLQMVMQSVQVAVALGAGSDLSPALAGLMGDLAYTVSVIAYVPLAVLLGAVAAVEAFPVWARGLSGVTAAANLAMSLGLVMDGGILAPGGTLTYVLYALTAIWLPAVTTVMVVRPSKGLELTVSEIS